MIVLLYIFTLPSPRVLTSALAVQYPCFPHKPRVADPMTKGSGIGDMNDECVYSATSMYDKCPIPQQQEGNCNKTKEVLCRRGRGDYHLLLPPPRICAPSLPIGGRMHCKVFLDREGPTTEGS